MAYTQERRICELITPLGKDELLVASLSVHEEISGLFGLDFELVSEKGEIPFANIIGKSATVRIELENGSQRYWNGYVSRFSQGASDDRFVYYRAGVVPWLWFMTRTSDCRIFQEKSVPQIVQQIFGEWSFSDFRAELTGSYEPREYCVQYRETDCNFVMRLLEEEGISFYFEHGESNHTMVLVDSQSANPAFSEIPQVEYAPAGDKAARSGEIDDWLVEQELHPGRYTHTDYNFKTPGDDLGAFSNTTEKVGANDRFEVFDYPGEYKVQGDGERYAKLRIEAEEAAGVAVTGSSDCAEFSPGYTFELQKHYRQDFNQKYLLTGVDHQIVEGVSRGSVESTYRNSFTCIPNSVQFRPKLATPKPLIQGVQTAVVVGRSGEEIHVDEYGRVKVQFHWDREGKRDEKSSCWIRVSQSWAGKNWGWVSIPRIGQEVIVEFEEGDPDRPIITGRVYNAGQMPPYELPTHGTRTAFKSRSSKGGSPTNYNEILFEDKKGKEQIFINAERALDERIEADARRFVGNQAHLIVKKDQKEMVEANKHARVKGDHLEKIDGSMSLDVGMNQDEKVAMKYALESGQEIHLKAGMKVIIESGLQLSLKAAGGFIDIGPAGISISGTLVNINSGGAAGAGSGASPKAPEDPDKADDGSAGDKLS